MALARLEASRLGRAINRASRSSMLIESIAAAIASHCCALPRRSESSRASAASLAFSTWMILQAAAAALSSGGSLGVSTQSRELGGPRPQTLARTFIRADPTDGHGGIPQALRIHTMNTVHVSVTELPSGSQPVLGSYVEIDNTHANIHADTRKTNESR